MRLVTAVLLSFCAVGLARLPVATGGVGQKAPEPIDAEALIKECLDFSEDDRASGNTAQMRQGAWKTIDCYGQRILEQAGVLLVPEVIDEFQTDLNELGKAYARLYWKIYNDRRFCSPTCGTIYHLFPAGRADELYKQLLRDVVDQLNADAREAAGLPAYPD